jgi:hypothetical protein
MQLFPLSKVRRGIRIGSPLPFSIRDASNRLLLARDAVVDDERQLEALVDEGACVDADELAGTHAEICAAPLQRLPALRQRLGDTLAGILERMPDPAAPAALDEAARDLGLLTERSPDLALFLLVRPDPSGGTPYSVVRCLHAAAAAWLIALRLGWPEARRLTLVKAAFTMNLGMLDLQERLSNQARLVGPMQRQAIHDHPRTSEATLRESGVADESWLQAVAQHHERPGGGGYPAGLAQVDEMANALRTVDLYTAKLAGRSGRDCLPPPRAARDLLVEERGNPFALALVTEFGMNPPGTLVRLLGGEVGVVVRRTADSNSPQVAVLTSRRGEPLHEPLLREASGREFGIAGPAEPAALRGRSVSAERLYAAESPTAAAATR